MSNEDLAFTRNTYYLNYDRRYHLKSLILAMSLVITRSTYSDTMSTHTKCRYRDENPRADLSSKSL